jgi:D-3-phosphoglycerate dehydrogenase
VKIFVASASFARNTLLLKELNTLGFPVTLGKLRVPQRELSEGELLEQFGDHEILLLGRTPLSRQTVEQLGSLKFVSAYGVGLDHVDKRALLDHGIQLGWTPGVNRRAVAEMVVGIILNHGRNLSVSYQRMEQSHWIKDGGIGLDGQTIGIIGMGAIGSELVKMLEPWDLKIIYYDIVDRAAVAGRGQKASFDEVMIRSDIISLHVPLTPETHLMINRETLKLAQKSALLINTSRGTVVDFEGTCEAVLSGQLGGFAVDVYEQEPFLGAPWKHPRIYMTPHVGGNSQQAVLLMGRAAIAQIQQFMQ